MGKQKDNVQKPSCETVVLKNKKRIRFRTWGGFALCSTEF